MTNGRNDLQQKLVRVERLAKNKFKEFDDAKSV